MLEDIFSTLGDPTRKGIIEVLRTRPRRAGELAQRLGTSPQAMSKHLRLLRQHGLVEEQSPPDDARARVYTLRPEPFARMQEWLEEVAGFWTDQLAGFKAHAEKKKGKRP